MRFIIFCISLNCLTSWLTSLGWVPQPLAMRRRRDPSMIVEVGPLGRRHRADDRLHPGDLARRRSRRSCSSLGMPGIIPTRS